MGLSNFKAIGGKMNKKQFLISLVFVSIFSFVMVLSIYADCDDAASHASNAASNASDAYD
jgi:hypothetical protein